MQVTGPTARDCFQELWDFAFGSFEAGDHASGQTGDTVDTGFTLDDVLSVLVDKPYDGIVPRGLLERF